MRSRYSAFTLADVEYLKKTAKGQALKTFDENGTKAFASKALWLGLSIIKCDDFDGKNIGYVEFIARFIYQGNKEQIHEMSRFEKIQGLWYYTEGKHL